MDLTTQLSKFLNDLGSGALGTTVPITLVTIGTNPAVGTAPGTAINLANNAFIRARNSANNADGNVIGLNNSDQISIGPAVTSVNLGGKFVSYNGLATAGEGVPVIVASARSTAQAGAVASVATFSPAADGTFLVSANVLVTTATSHSFQVNLTYTDEGNTAHTIRFNMQESVAGGAVLTDTIGNAAGAIPYSGCPLLIRVKGGTAITIATTGTFTTVTYNVEGLIQQIA